jgi:hypothetical protein
VDEAEADVMGRTNLLLFALRRDLKPFVPAQFYALRYNMGVPSQCARPSYPKIWGIIPHADTRTKGALLCRDLPC